MHQRNWKNKTISGLALYRAKGMGINEAWLSVGLSWLIDFLIEFYPKAAVQGHPFGHHEVCSGEYCEERCSDGEIAI